MSNQLQIRPPVIQEEVSLEAIFWLFFQIFLRRSGLFLFLILGTRHFVLEREFRQMTGLSGIQMGHLACKTKK
ncbi:unnamed protein product [Rhizophagus irregularis]|nr:unnamed protein product [Rhizophagus irregularis]